MSVVPFPAQPEKKRILLVDDHAIMRQGLVQVINQQPTLTVCGEASSPQEALAAAERLQPDLALVDLSLREGDGIELLKDLRARQPRMLTMVLSMHDEALYAERTLRAGGRGYVMKDEKMERLLLALHRVLAGGIYVSDKVTAHAVQRMARTNGGTAKPKAEDAYVERLTDRELQVFRLIGQGLGTRLIAEALHLSRKTIESHREHIKTKLGLKDGSELIQRAIQWARTADGCGGVRGGGQKDAGCRMQDAGCRMLDDALSQMKPVILSECNEPKDFLALQAV